MLSRFPLFFNTRQSPYESMHSVRLEPTKLILLFDNRGRVFSKSVLSIFFERILEKRVDISPRLKRIHSHAYRITYSKRPGSWYESNHVSDRADRSRTIYSRSST